MRTNIRILSLLFLFVTSLFSSVEIEFSKEEKEWIKNNSTITYSEVNWKPLSIIENNQMNGIMGDYLKLVAKRTGLKFDFVPSTSWPHVLKQFEEGKIDLVPGIGQSPQETKLGLVSREYATYPMVIVTSNKYKYIESLKELENKVIAIPKYYTSYNFVVQNYPQIKLITTSNIQEALLLVANGKADAFVGHIATSLHYMAENYLENLKITGTTSFKFEHHYLIQNENKILLSIINKTFDSISYQERKVIYDKWIQTTIVEEKIDYKIILIIVVVFLAIIALFFYRQLLLKKYNTRLKESYHDVQNIINSTMNGIMISKDNICIEANTSALELFAYSKEDILGKKIPDLVCDDSMEDIKKALSLKSLVSYEINLVKSDGTFIPALVQSKNIQLNNETVVITTFVDISELKNQEKIIIEQSKMIAIGEMISNISHQWRQPLSIITSIVSSWKAYEELGILDKKTILEEVDVIIDNAEHLSNTIDDFMIYIKHDDSKSEFTFLQLTDSLLRLEKSFIKSNYVEVIRNIECNDKIYLNKNRLLQALVNILNNSVESLSKKEDDERYVIINIKEDESSYFIDIIDNAGGISDDIIEKVFEPYFSTKEDLNGFGLGLYKTYTIIEKLNGKISIKNKTFELNDKEHNGIEVSIILSKHKK